MTEREAELAARVEQLEAEAKASALAAAQGGVFESVWLTINRIVPRGLAVTALAVFLAHHAFGYYMAAQTAEAETQRKEAEADVEKAKADAANARTDGLPLRVQQAQADLKLKQQQAARAKAEAEALNSDENNATLRLRTVEAEIATAQEKANLARAQADAKAKQSGLRTLEERLQIAKATVTEMAAAHDRMVAALADDVSAGRVSGFYGPALQAVCDGNQFARLLDCPAQYVHEDQPSVADVPPSPPAATPPAAAPLRKPAKFDCDKASMGSDYVICSSPTLLDAEAKLEDAYSAARAARGSAAWSEQKNWMRDYGVRCGLKLHEQPSARLIASAKSCVLDALLKRTADLQGNN